MNLECSRVNSFYQTRFFSFLLDSKSEKFEKLLLQKLINNVLLGDQRGDSLLKFSLQENKNDNHQHSTKNPNRGKYPNFFWQLDQGCRRLLLWIIDLFG